MNGERLLIKDARLAIITALPKEFTACQTVFRSGASYLDKKTGLSIALSSLKVKGHRKVVLIAMMPGMGNILASICADRLLRSYPKIEHLFMCGIAGAVPNPTNPDTHVRLGDIVVVSQAGIVQYDFCKETLGEITEYRHPPRPPSMQILSIVRQLEANALQNKRPWEKLIERSIKKLGKAWKRPPAKSDKLHEWDNLPTPINHPPRERSIYPKIFLGTIASASTLLKNPKRRNALREKFGVLAIEMESSGIADASAMSQKSYYVIRGTCDYCDPHKSDLWQKYAAVIAASFTRKLVEAMPTDENKLNVLKRVPAKSKLHKKQIIDKEKMLLSLLDSEPKDWTFHQNKEAFFHPRIPICIKIEQEESAELNLDWAKQFQNSSAFRVKCEIRWQKEIMRQYFFVRVDQQRALLPLPTNHPSLCISKEEFLLSKILNPDLSEQELRKYFNTAKIEVKK